MGLRPIRFPVRALVVICIPTLLFLGLTASISRYTGLPFSFFSRDPTASLGGHPLLGIQSSLGVLALWGTALVCVVTYAVLKRRVEDGDLALFLLGAGVFTMWLALDDLFLFHDDLAYRHLGLRDKPIYLAYGFVCLLGAVRFRRVILRSEYVLLVVASFFFGSSILVDALHTRWESPWRIFFEDGFKLLGVVTWSVYLVRTSFQALVGSFLIPRPDEVVTDAPRWSAPPT